MKRQTRATDLPRQLTKSRFAALCLVLLVQVSFGFFHTERLAQVPSYTTTSSGDNCGACLLATTHSLEGTTVSLAYVPPQSALLPAAPYRPTVRAESRTTKSPRGPPQAS